MLSYFLTFTLLGFFVRKFFEKDAEGIVIIIAIIWGFSSGAVWGFVSLGEMFLGFYIARHLR
jgi:hypothetical protein